MPVHDPNSLFSSMQIICLASVDISWTSRKLYQWTQNKMSQFRLQAMVRQDLYQVEMNVKVKGSRPIPLREF